MSKYKPLADHLGNLDANTVCLSFSDVERIIGTPLPESARRHLAWWANSRTPDSHVWAHQWLRAGWEVSGISLKEQVAHFQRVEHFEVESPKAREGYDIDRTLLTKGRNAALADERKRLDNYTCQACGFRLLVESRWVIEAHHMYPLSTTGETETEIGHLVSLCPTCHRIAHIRSPPFAPDEIRERLGVTPSGA